MTSTPCLTSAERALLRVNARVLTGLSRQGPLPQTARGLFPSVFPGQQFESLVQVVANQSFLTLQTGGPWEMRKQSSS